MRFVIYGAGGIGGTIGARLHRAGYDVSLIARGEHGAALIEHGLSFIGPEGEFTLDIPAVTTPAELEFQPDDMVLLCMNRCMFPPSVPLPRHRRRELARNERRIALTAVSSLSPSLRRL